MEQFPRRFAATPTPASPPTPESEPEGDAQTMEADPLSLAEAIVSQRLHGEMRLPNSMEVRFARDPLLRYGERAPKPKVRKVRVP